MFIISFLRSSRYCYDYGKEIDEENRETYKANRKIESRKRTTKRNN